MNQTYNYFCHLGQHGTVTDYPNGHITTGYGTDAQGRKSCVDCIGKQDRIDLINLPIGGKAQGYLTGNKKDGFTYQNWPGTLKIKCDFYKESRANWGNKRTDAWFTIADDSGNKHYFWLRQIGDFNQVAHVQKVKAF